MKAVFNNYQYQTIEQFTIRLR